MENNKVILLNGVSSAGKTSISKTIQTLSDEPYLHLGIDTAFAMIPERFWNDIPLIDIAFTNLHKMCAGLCSDGLNIVIDHVVVRECEIKELLSLFKGKSLYSIKVDCNFEIIKQREINRGDRLIGLAQTQSVKIDRFVDYDLTINTETISPEQNAKIILDYISKEPTKALQNMLKRYGIN